MLYTYRLAEPAVPQFQQLESWLAEAMLDELESLVNNPTPSRVQAFGGFVYDFKIIHKGDAYYVFLTVMPDSIENCLWITRVGLHIRRL